jgi:hypothetical protein
MLSIVSMIGHVAFSRVRHVTIDFVSSDDTRDDALSNFTTQVWPLLGTQQLQSLHIEVLEDNDSSSSSSGSDNDDRKKECGYSNNWLSQKWNGVPASFTTVTSLAIENHCPSSCYTGMRWPPSLTSFSATRVANLDLSDLPASCTKLSLKECCWHDDNG